MGIAPCLMTASYCRPCVVCAVTSKALERFLLKQLFPQVAEHRGIADVIVRYAECTNLLCLGIDTYV